MLPAQADIPDDEHLQAPDDDPERELTPDEFYGGPSKSQLKRESTALQDLGAELASLSADQIKKIEMPDNLREALLESHRIHAHGAKKRQLQLIGKIMRSVDPAPLTEALDVIKGVSVQAKAHQQRLERLRERVMASDSEFAVLARDYPHADIQQLRQLRRNALKEAEQKKPPRAYRELFRQLRELIDSAPPPQEVGTDETAPGIR
jgi:ribosome-associated protein